MRIGRNILLVSVAAACVCRQKSGGRRPPRPHGFTLLELLCVLAVVGLLAALIIPSVGAARRAANKTRTKVRFAQWTAAFESFRSEYGYYPVLSASALVNPPGQSTDPAAVHLFHDLLAGRRRNGDPLPAYDAASPLSPEGQNRKRISFCQFSSGDFTPADSAAPNLLRDASDNTEIAVLVDRDLDGVVKPGSDFAVLPAVGGLIPGRSDFPDTGVRAGVIFYAPGPGANPANPEFICSWK